MTEPTLPVINVPLSIKETEDLYELLLHWPGEQREHLTETADTVLTKLEKLLKALGP